jgi:hypothetical protein
VYENSAGKFRRDGDTRNKMELTMPKQILPLKNTASATNPLSQNNMVKPSKPNNAHRTLGFFAR